MYLMSLYAGCTVEYANVTAASTAVDRFTRRLTIHFIQLTSIDPAVHSCCDDGSELCLCQSK
jgi:hypothetical protein